MAASAPGLPRVHAHRGDSSRHPENTMAAFHAARLLGVDAIEFDVQSTLDGHLVVLHDLDLARTTTGSGLVHERELAYVRSLSAGAWFGRDWAAERVPLLDEVLALDDVDFELELKGVPTPAFVSAVAGAVRRSGTLERIRFTSFHPVALMALRAELPRAALGLFPREQQSWTSGRLYQEIAIATALTGRYQVVHLPHRLLPTVDVDAFHRHGLGVHSGEAGPSPLDAFELGVDGLTTNWPQVALAARRTWLAGRAG